jgi:hypothetical protein
MTSKQTWNDYRKEAMKKRPADMSYKDYLKQVSLDWKTAKLNQSMGGSFELNPTFVIHQPPVLHTNSRKSINEQSSVVCCEEETSVAPVSGKGVKPRKKTPRCVKDETLGVVRT